MKRDITKFSEIRKLKKNVKESTGFVRKINKF